MTRALPQSPNPIRSLISLPFTPIEPQGPGKPQMSLRDLLLVILRPLFVCVCVCLCVCLGVFAWMSEYIKLCVYVYKSMFMVV